MKKVSVIIPVYNVESYLRQCLDSVLAQSYKNLEVICVDDGGTDCSFQICKEYADSDSRIKIIRQTNCGVSRARNNGIEASTGDFIFFLDSDDYLDPECIYNLMIECERGYFPILGYKLDIMGIGVQEVGQSYGEYETLTDYLKDFHKYFATKFSFVWGKLFSSKIVKEYKIDFPEDIMLGEDMLFNLKYYTHYNGKISVLKYNGYFYRQSGTNSLSKKFDIRMFDWNALTYNKLIDYLVSYNVLDEVNLRHLMKNILGNYMYSFRLVSLNEQLTKKAKKSLISKYRSTPIFIESLKYYDNQSFVTRLVTRLFIWLINNGYITTYIYLEKLKYNIRK